MRLFHALLCGVALSTASFPARSETRPEGFADSLLQCVTTRCVPAERYVWNWRDAVLLKALIDCHDLHPERRKPVEQYVETAMRVSAGRIHGRHPNGVASGAGLAFLLRIGVQDPAVAAAADTLYGQYGRIKRFGGASSHRPGRIELWDDSVYMVALFLLEMYRATGQERYLNDCIREIKGHAARLRNPRTGLWYHGWSVTSRYYDDSCCQYMWNANQLQRNTECWGRGNGWIAMTLADVLALLPKDHPERATLQKWFTSMMRTLCRIQDRDTGHWRQLPLRTGEARSGNYIESSATAMFGYALAKGVADKTLRGGVFRRSARRAWNGLLAHSIENRGTDSLTLGNICAGTCIGERAYYYARPIVTNESFALGALLQLALQMERIAPRKNLLQRLSNHTSNP